MYYKMVGNVLERTEKVSKEEIADSVFLGYLTMEEWKQQCAFLEIPEHISAQIQSIDTTFRSSMQIQGEYLFGTVTIIDVKELNKNRAQIGIVFHQHYMLLISIVDEEGDIRAGFERALEKYSSLDSIAKVLYAFLDGLLQGASESLEKMEKQMVIMEHEVVQERIGPELNKDIFRLKKQLTTLRNYYEELIDLAQELWQNELAIFSKEELHYFRIFLGKAKRMSESVKEAKEGLIHLKEALDANLEYNLNRIMKMFTVVTTVFLPLTLIVGWYGMNFQYMPELQWRYGYVFVIVISIVVVVCCLVFFRRKHLL